MGRLGWVEWSSYGLEWEADVKTVSQVPAVQHPLTSARISIGRARSNDVTLADQMISSIHAELKQVSPSQPALAAWVARGSASFSRFRLMIL